MIKIQREKRTMDRLEYHYQIEKTLANRLRNASAEERKYLYKELNNELYRLVLDHPLLTRKSDAAASQKTISSQINLLKPFITKKDTFLEMGPGDCSLSFEVAKYVNNVIAIDVSDEITKSKFRRPSNFELIICDGTSIDVQPNSVDVAYSRSFMEHLHPDDARMQLNNIYTAVSPGGIYFCITPHRFSGPWDISMYFDKVATGFHLKEYTYSELDIMFKSIGFSRVDAIIGYGGIYLKLPIRSVMLLENLLQILPQRIKELISHTPLFQFLLGIKIVATK
jgi:SAM-dependent methyltransferase